MKNSQIKIAIFCALFSAMLYALYPPIAKSLIVNCPPIYLAAFLYLGTFGGLILFTPLTKANLKAKSIQKSDYKALLFVIFTNIAASIFMNWGVQLTSAGNIALLGNFEVVATAIVALIFFHQKFLKFFGQQSS
ncbi:DMT family transporter [Lactobacillus sp. PV034]|uniref:DMT family transporter n=1 Tax=Lactobacillus sp. PV034 TaxID=2594495 RepID=UPI00223FA5CC|nr:DMT family transporter [Lactobacillus sp. PV034]QNQ80829.1 DMT family transporter [Lactobacillus sp. PV034]